MRHGNRLWILAFPLLLLACQQPPTRTRINLTAHDANGQPQRHYTDFRRAYYQVSAGGLVELVLQTERPSSVDPTQTINQILYVRSIWNPHPGRSAVEASQIDAQARYAMLTPPTGVRYDGSAMITWKLDKKAHKLSGWIESGTLTPRFRMGEAMEPFGPANFSGTFVAEENPRVVVETAQALESQFNRPIVPNN